MKNVTRMNAVAGMTLDGVDANHLTKQDMANAMKIKLFGRV